MKKLLLNFLFLTAFSFSSMFAQSVTSSQVQIATGGLFGGSAFYSGTGTNHTSFEGHDFGQDPSQLTINISQLVSEDGGSVTVDAVVFFYALYEEGATPSYTNIALSTPNTGATKNWEVSPVSGDLILQATNDDTNYEVQIGWTLSLSNGMTLTDGPFTATFTRGAPADALPAELIDFTAEIDGSNVELVWSTAQEINNDYFAIERKTADSDWEVIGKKAGNGTVSEEMRYTFTDENPANGINLYRLQQFDFDGNTEYSFTVKAEVVTRSEINVFPNPTASAVTVNLPVGFDRGNISVYDTTGKQVYTLSVNSQSSVNIDDLATGIYIVRLTDENGAEVAQTKLRKL